MKIVSVKEIEPKDVSGCSNYIDLFVKNRITKSILEKCEFELAENQEYKELEREYFEALADRDFASCKEIMKQMENAIMIITYRIALNSLLS